MQKSPASKNPIIPNKCPFTVDYTNSLSSTIRFVKMNKSKKKVISIVLGSGLCFVILCLIINRIVLWEMLNNAKKEHNISDLRAIKSEIKQQLNPDKNGYSLLKQFEENYQPVDSFREIYEPFFNCQPPLAQPVQPFFITHAKDIIQKNEVAINLLDKFSNDQIKYCIDPSKILGESGYGCDLFSHVAPLITIKAQIAATEHNTNGAIKTILVGLQLLKIQKNSSFYFMNVFNSHWANKSILKTIEIMLNLTTFNDVQLVQLYKNLENLEQFDKVLST